MDAIEALDELRRRLVAEIADRRAAAAEFTADDSPEAADHFRTQAGGIGEAVKVLDGLRGELTTERTLDLEAIRRIALQALSEHMAAKHPRTQDALSADDLEALTTVHVHQHSIHDTDCCLDHDASNLGHADSNARINELTAAYFAATPQQEARTS